jgi:hypothetical protein
MYKGKKIIACSPVGRKSSMICLFNQILKYRHVVDEHHLWVNTTVQEDLNFINEYANANPDFVKLKYGCDELDPKQMGRAHNVKRFYNYCVESDTFYYKIDDDIIFIENGTFEKLAQYKLDNPKTFLLYPTIINNYWCTHFLRKYDAIDVPECNTCSTTWYLDFNKVRMAMKNCSGTMSDDLNEPKPRDFIPDPENRFFSPLYWSNPYFSYEILNHTYEYIVENKLSNLNIPNIILDYEPVSINFIMWSGEDFAKFDGNVKSVDDEPWLSIFYPLKYDLFNAIVGDTRVVHYAYWPQRSYLDQTDILKKYEKV